MIEEMNHRAQYPILQTLHSLHQLSGIAIGDGEGGHPKGPLRAANVRVARVEESTLQHHALAREGRSLSGPRGAASGEQRRRHAHQAAQRAWVLGAKLLGQQARRRPG